MHFFLYLAIQFVTASVVIKLLSGLATFTNF